MKIGTFLLLNSFKFSILLIIDANAILNVVCCKRIAIHVCEGYRISLGLRIFRGSI